MKSKRQTCQSIGRMLRVNVSMVTKPFILWILLQGKASMKTVRQRDRERLYSKRTCLYTDRCSCYCAVRCEDTSASLPLREQYNTTCSSSEIDDLQLRTDLLGPLWKMFKVCKVSQVLLNSREFLTEVYMLDVYTMSLFTWNEMISQNLPESKILAPLMLMWTRSLVLF